MERGRLLGFWALGLVFILSGCVVRTYPLTRDRLDQDLNIGNRGYLKGDAPEPGERKMERTTRVIEVEIGSPLKFEKTPKVKPARETAVAQGGVGEDEEVWGNRGYITESETPQIQESASQGGSSKYTVKKGDTLQKISKKFYGTTRKWNRIYKANKQVLKSQNKIYPGQVLDIPLDSSTKLIQTQENLK